MDSLLPEDQKICVLDQLSHRYQGLSREMKTKVMVKPTVCDTTSNQDKSSTPSYDIFWTVCKSKVKKTSHYTYARMTTS